MPARRASAITGTRAARDTRCGSSNVTETFTSLCNNRTCEVYSQLNGGGFSNSRLYSRAVGELTVTRGPERERIMMKVTNSFMGILSGVGLLAATFFLAPQAALASTFGQPGAASSHSVATTRTIALPASACAALRHSRHNESIGCKGQETIHLTPIRANGTRAGNPSAASVAASTYWKGFATACGGTPGSPCKAWSVSIHIAFTTSGTDAWVNRNNSTYCSQSGTTNLGCNFSNNGTSKLIMEATFSSDGWLQFVVPNGNGYFAYTPHVSWANLGRLCTLPGNGCYT